jgi:hypothetical protein
MPGRAMEDEFDRWLDELDARVYRRFSCTSECKRGCNVRTRSRTFVNSSMRAKVGVRSGSARTRASAAPDCSGRKRA